MIEMECVSDIALVPREVNAERIAMEIVNVKVEGRRENVGEVDNHMCAICLEELFTAAVGVCTVLDNNKRVCSHMLHVKCLEGWGVLRNCPCCRYGVLSSCYFLHINILA